MARYIDDFVREVAANPAPVPEPHRIRYFLAGLADQTFITTMIQTHSPTTTTDLLRLARQYAGMATTGGASAARSSMPTAGSMNASDASGPAPMEVNAIGSAKETRRCYACGKIGHIRSNCRSAKENGTSRGQDGSRGGGNWRGRGGAGGRKERGQWRERRAYVVEEEELSPEGATEVNTFRPYLPRNFELSHCTVVTVRGNPSYVYTGRVRMKTGEWRVVKVLVDSGASKSMVSTRLAQILTRERISNGRRTVFRFANGTVYESNEQCSGVTLQLDTGYETSLDLLVCNLQTFDVILGQTWLRKENPTINWKTGTITLTSTNTVKEPETQRTHQQRDSVASVHATQEDVQTGESRERSSAENDEPTTSAESAKAKSTIDIEVVSAVTMRRMMKKPANVQSVATLIPKAATEASADTTSTAQAPGQNHPTTGSARFSDLIKEFAELFIAPTELPPARPGHDHRIVLEPDALPPFRNPFKLSHDEASELSKQLEALLEKQYIRPSSSPYGAPVLFARKKDGSLRLCIDYRLLNKVTVRDRYPLPDISGILDQMSGAKIFSKLDLKAGYHQVRVAEEDVAKTAFTTHMGAFEWRVLPMGLTNAPPTFQRLMNSILGPFQKFARVYLDDVIIFSRTEEEHVEQVKAVLGALRKNGLRLNPQKCIFGVHEIGFLGHVIKAGKIAMEADKVAVVQEWVTPRTKKQLQSFLGFANFYRKYVRHFAEIAAPLTDMLHGLPGNAALPTLTPAAVAAFEALKRAVAQAPVLHMVDPDATMVVYTDASEVAIGAVLHQRVNEEEVPVAFASRRLTDTETRYDTRDKELLGVMFALKQWRHYLLGRKFELRTDHASLEHLQTMDIRGRKGRLARWAEELADYDFTLRHIKGTDNAAADALSRQPAQVNNVMMESRATVAIPGADIGDVSKDAYFGPVIAILQGCRPTSAMWEQRATRFRLIENKELYLVDLTDTGREHLRRCVAGQANQERLIQAYHDAPTGGHQSAERTSEALSDAFFWPRMAKAVKRFVTQCDSCQRIKPNNRPQHAIQPVEVIGYVTDSSRGCAVSGFS